MSPPLPIVLRPARTRKQSRQIPWLVEKLGLDVYGTSLLTDRGRAELVVLAGMLAVVALFDWLAWTFLFNAILHSQAGALTWRTLLAAGLAVMVTAMVILFERGFLTMDLTRQRRKVWLRLGTRLVVILVAALVTAKPVELLAFRPAIELRTHQEKVTAYAIDLLSRIDEIEKNQTTLEPVRRADGETCQAYKNLDERELELFKLEAMVDKLGGEHRAAGQSLEALRQEALAAPGDEELEQRISRAQHRLQRVAAELGEKRALAQNGALELKFLKTKNPDLKGECDREFQGSQASRELQLSGFEAEKGKIKEHLNILRRSDPRSVDGLGVRVGAQEFVYRFSEFDVWNQLRILDDLLGGRPARWEGGMDEQVRKRAEVLDLMPPPDCAAAACSEEERREWTGLEAAGGRYRIWSWAVFAVAVLVPCLALLIKLFAPLDLVHYYSLASQYRAGHPDAIQVAEAEGEEIR